MLQLSGDIFEALFVSPLTRATETADIITQDRQLTTTTLPALREIDLYSFQVSSFWCPGMAMHCLGNAFE